MILAHVGYTFSNLMINASHLVSINTLAYCVINNISLPQYFGHIFVTFGHIFCHIWAFMTFFNHFSLYGHYGNFGHFWPFLAIFGNFGHFWLFWKFYLLTIFYKKN